MRTTAVRTRRLALVLAVLAAGLVLVLVSIGLGRSRGVGPGDADADVLVRDVRVQQADPTYTVESVRAVVRGGRAFLAVRVTWPDDPRDGAAVHAAPRLSGTVVHGQPYPGLDTTCGVGTDPTERVEDTSEGMTLPCSGLLVPDDVTSVALRD